LKVNVAIQFKFKFVIRKPGLCALYSDERGYKLNDRKILVQFQTRRRDF